MAKPILLLQPASLDLAPFYGRRMHTFIDEARYLVHCVIDGALRGREDLYGFVPLKQAYFRRLIDKNRLTQHLGALTSHDVLRRDGVYVIGKKSLGYQLGEQYRFDELVRIPITYEPLARKVRQLIVDLQRKKSEALRESPEVYQWLRRMQETFLGIDEAAARKEVNRLSNDQCKHLQGILIDKIVRCEFLFSIGRNSGRIFNSITGLKSSVRGRILLNGQQTESVDISNSQPAFHGFGITLTARSSGITVPKHLQDGLSVDWYTDNWTTGNYVYACESGELYEQIAQAAGHDLKRGDVKVGVLRDVFGRKKPYPSYTDSAFGQLFPGVRQGIWQLNCGYRRHNRTLLWLQQLEAWFMLRRVCEHLRQDYGEAPIVTVHDSIYFPADDAWRRRVHGAIRKMAGQIGISFRTKPPLLAA